MIKSTKIAISLPGELLQGVESHRRASGESRSEFFRRAVETLLHREREREAIEQYIQGYRRHPETPEELGWVEEASKGVLSEYPWQDRDEE